VAKGLAEVLRFGRYEPLFRIGIGGMAEVYAARIRGEAGFQKLVAVKRMLPHLSGDQRFVNMFLDEARLAASISSPHVVQTLDLGRAEDDSLYIVMELAVGVTLADVMRWHGDRGDLCDPGVALELLAQAAQGLDDAHEARAPTGEPLHLVHRDMSPQNILVGIDGRARVSDFGIAHAVHLRRTHTQVGEKKGKFSYFSPEQAFGHPLDRRSDVFSLGIVAWELLSGRRLFRGAMQEAILAVRERPVPHLSQVRPELAAEVSDTVMHALERDLDSRYPTAAQCSRSAIHRRRARSVGSCRTSAGAGSRRCRSGSRPRDLAAMPRGRRSCRSASIRTRSRTRAASEAAISWRSARRRICPSRAH
jgi:serine/threonine-protein kinase